MFQTVLQKHVSRRAFLRGSGVVLALPWLDAMLPAFATRAQAADATAAPKRFVAMMYSLGFHAPHFFPQGAGTDYAPSEYLKLIDRHRRDFTVISGLSHAEQNGNNGHASSLTWLTAAKHPGLPGFKNSISLDQYLVEKLQPNTRFPSLVLSVGGEKSLSWTASGIQLPGDSSPSALFARLFLAGSPTEIEQQVHELKRGRSILDTLGGMAKRFNQSLGPRDQQKLDQYFTSVRELEAGIQQREGWVNRPKPQVVMVPPRDVTDRFDIIAQTRLMHNLITLALQTDSTRFITYAAGGFNPVPKIEGVDTGWHDLSHHGQDQEKIDELAIIERAEFQEIDRLLMMLKEATDAGSPVLDNTTVLIGSNLGNASAHHWRDLPILVAGGGFKHGQHVVAGGVGLENNRFCNLFVQIARQMGVDIQQFGSSDATRIEGL
ncbi:MAG: DUF1552 domain-containing protein [Pirellulaceae bacterium]